MDEQEFCDFFAARGPTLRRIAYLVVGDWHTAEDVTQTAMARLYGRWRRVRLDSVEAYARKAVVNEALSALRRRRDVPVETLHDGALGHAAGPTDPLDDRLARALRALPPQQRATVALRFLDDQSVAETARVLGVTTGTVKSQTARALSTLRLHVTDLTLAEEPR